MFSSLWGSKLQSDEKTTKEKCSSVDHHKTALLAQ